MSPSSGSGLNKKGLESNKGWLESRLSFRKVPPPLLLWLQFLGGATGEDPAIATEGGPAVATVGGPALITVGGFADVGGLDDTTVGGFNAVPTSGILDV